MNPNWTIKNCEGCGAPPTPNRRRGWTFTGTCEYPIHCAYCGRLNQTHPLVASEMRRRIEGPVIMKYDVGDSIAATAAARENAVALAKTLAGDRPWAALPDNVAVERMPAPRVPLDLPPVEVVPLPWHSEPWFRVVKFAAFMVTWWLAYNQLIRWGL